jgi:hypothetical protein
MYSIFLKKKKASRRIARDAPGTPTSATDEAPSYFISMNFFVIRALPEVSV